MKEDYNYKSAYGYFRLDRCSVARIDAWRDNQGYHIIPSRSAAIRELIERGLRAVGKEEQPTAA